MAIVRRSIAAATLATGTNIMAAMEDGRQQHRGRRPRRLRLTNGTNRVDHGQQSPSPESSYRPIVSSNSSPFGASSSLQHHYEPTQWPVHLQFHTCSLVSSVSNSDRVAVDGGLSSCNATTMQGHNSRDQPRQLPSTSCSASSFAGSTLPWRECQCLPLQTTALSPTSSHSQASSRLTTCPLALSSISSSTSAPNDRPPSLSSAQTFSTEQQTSVILQPIPDVNSHSYLYRPVHRFPKRPQAMFPPVRPQCPNKETLFCSSFWLRLQSVHRLFVILMMSLAVCSQFTTCDTQTIADYIRTASSEEPRLNRTITLMQLSQMNRKIRQPQNTHYQFCEEPPLVPNAISHLKRNQKHNVFPLGQVTTYMCIQGYKAVDGVAETRCSYPDAENNTPTTTGGSHVFFPDSVKGDDSEHHVVLLGSARSKNSKRLVSDLDEEPDANANGHRSVVFPGYNDKRKMSRKTDDDLIGSVYDASPTNLDGRNSDLENDNVEYLEKRKQKMEKSIRNSRPQWWPLVTLNCQPVTCTDPGQVENADRRTNASLDQFIFNSNVHYICAEGYETIGIPFLTCKANGSWNRPLPKCHLKQCPMLPPLENGRILYNNERKTDSRAEYHCDSGFRLNALTTVRHCHTDDNWSILEPANFAANQSALNDFYRCVPVECPPPPRPHPGIRVLNLSRKRKNYSPGDVIIYTCDSVKTRATAKCRPDGEWSREPPHCPEMTPKCPPLPHFPHGVMNLGATKANFSCFEGFVLDGPSTITCLQKGAWSSVIPTCTVVDKKPKDDIKPSYGENLIIDQEEKKSSKTLTILLVGIAIVATSILVIAGWVVFRIRRDKLTRKRWQQYFGRYQHRQSKTHIVMSTTYANNLNGTNGISAGLSHNTGNSTGLNGASRQLLQRARTDSNGTNRHQTGNFLQSSFSSSDDNAAEVKSFNTGTISSEHARTVSSYADDTCPEDEYDDDDDDLYSNASILQMKGLAPASPPIPAARRVITPSEPQTTVNVESTPMMLMAPSTMVATPAPSSATEHTYTNVPHPSSTTPFSGLAFPPPPSRKSNVPVTEL